MLIPFTSASFTNLSGLAVADGAAVEVRLELNGALAALFDDRDGTTPLTNPFNADSQGRFEFYVAGRIDGYSIQVTKGAQTHTLRHQLTGSAAATLFDNTGTGLSAESVQDAIEEINTSVLGLVFNVTSAPFLATGDGTTNDTTAVNAAISAASAVGGGLVFFPPGRTYFVQTINGAPNVGLIGGGASSIIKFDDDGTATSRNLFLSSDHDVTIRGLCFTSDATSRSGVYGLIRAESCNRLKILNCKFLTSPSTAIYVATCNDVLIQGNEVGDGTLFCYADGIHVNRQSTRVRIIANTLRGTQDDAIGVVSNKDTATFTANTDVVVEGNTIFGTTTAGSGISIVGGIGIIVKGNVCRGPFVQAGIFVSAAGDATYNAGTDIIVEGNVCSASSIQGINIAGLNKGVVSGNISFGNALQGIQLAGTTLNVSVVGNVCHNNAEYGIYEEAGSGPNTFFANLPLLNTLGPMLISGGNGSKIAWNVGFVSEARGTGSIASGTTTDVITHGLSATPEAANISIVFTLPGNNDYGRWWIDNVTSTQFQVNVFADPGSNLDFQWQAILV